MNIYDLKPKKASEFSSGNFWVVYGKNGSGKTHFIGTFPKPMLVVCFKDKGLNTIKSIPDTDFIEWDGTPDDLIKFCELYKDSPYKTIAFDTLGVYQEDVMTMIKTGLKKKKMEIQMWGDLGDYFSNVLRAIKSLSDSKTVVCSFHEQVENVEGYENEINPSVSISVYGNVIKKTLFGIANYVIHTFMYDHVDAQTMKSTYFHACHVGVNPYYWTKYQTEHKVPDIIFNPTYEELIKIKEGVYDNK